VIGAAIGVPADTVRGWLRVLAGRLEASRGYLWQVTRRAGVDVAVPDTLGCPWRDLVAMLGAATASVTGRFGPLGVLGPVTAVAGRRGVFGWSAPRPGLAGVGAGVGRQHQSPLTSRGDHRKPREGCRPAGPGAGLLPGSRKFSP
jgi:hypothetical protein